MRIVDNKNFDFLAVGDIVTDAFIRLKDAELHCDINHEHCEICMNFGAKIPYESVTVVPAVGNFFYTINDTFQYGEPFTHTGMLKSCGWKFERWLDVVLMEKTLGAGDTTAPA